MGKLIYLLIIALICHSCQDDDFESTPLPNTGVSLANDTTFIENFGASTTSNFIGRVVNENGGAVKDVQITIGNSITSTDHNGVFVLNNASVYEKFGYVKASKSGYINGSRAVVPSVNGTNDIQITLLKKNTIATVASGIVSEVSLPNGSKVAFQGDYINSNGSAYTGQVEVSMHYLQPNQEATFTQMPGMLFAQDVSNNARSLETYGMLGVNLYSPSGEQLNIAETSPASLTFPVDISTPNAPETITLWYFDELVGYWKEQGVATKMGNEYIAEVTHFTWWNCDLPLEYVTICFSVENATASKVSNKRIEIVRNLTGQVIFSGFTNENGEECGMFPANEEVTINVFSECSNTAIYSQTIGPFSSDTSVSITIPDFPSDTLNTNIIGSFTSCTGTPINDGYLFIFSDNDSNFSESIQIPIVNGTINYSFFYCSGDNYNYLVFDVDNGQSTIIEALNLNVGITNLGTVSTCQENGGVYVGDIKLYTQVEVDSFGLYGYSIIEGNLDIRWGNITSVESLQNLNGITLNLSIRNTQLSSLSGLDNIESVGKLSIHHNNSLISLQGLNGITELPNYGNLIYRNNNLLSLSGLNSLTKCNHMRVFGNNSLESLSGLENLNEVEQGLDMGSDYPNQGNPVLSDFCALTNLITNGTYSYINIANNLYNPTVQDIIDGNCAQ